MQKVNSKWITDLNVKVKNLGEKGEILQDLGKDFLELMPKSTIHKNKN